MTKPPNKAVENQRIADDKLLDLFKSVNRAFSFAKDVEELENKVKTLEDVITEILKQTTECIFFVQDYVRRGFYGTFECFRNLNMQITCRVERVAERIYKDQDAKIQQFTEAFGRLRGDLDTGMLQQAVFVTSKILENTNISGTIFDGAHDF